MSFVVIRRSYQAESALDGMKVMYSGLFHRGWVDRNGPAFHDTIRVDKGLFRFWDVHAGGSFLM